MCVCVHDPILSLTSLCLSLTLSVPLSLCPTNSVCLSVPLCLTFDSINISITVRTVGAVRARVHGGATWHWFMSVRVCVCQCVRVCVSFAVCHAFLSLIWAMLGLFFHCFYFIFFFLWFFFFCYFFLCTFLLSLLKVFLLFFISIHFIFSHICTQCSMRSLIYSMHAAAAPALNLSLTLSRLHSY